MKDAFNPEEETERDWDLDLRDDVKGECEDKYGKVAEIFVIKESQVSSLYVSHPPSNADPRLDVDRERFTFASKESSLPSLLSQVSTVVGSVDVKSRPRTSTTACLTPRSSPGEEQLLPSVFASRCRRDGRHPPFPPFASQIERTSVICHLVMLDGVERCRGESREHRRNHVTWNSPRLTPVCSSWPMRVHSRQVCSLRADGMQRG